MEVVDDDLTYANVDSYRAMEPLKRPHPSHYTASL